MSRGQSAIEFVLLVSFMLVVFFIFFGVIQGRIIDLTEQRDLLFLSEANNIVVSEVVTASSAVPDFEHTFVIPNSGEHSYYINITGDGFEVVSSFEDIEYVNFLPFNVTAGLNQLEKNNTVFNVDGLVIFPNGSELFMSEFSGVHINVNPEECLIRNFTGGCSYLNYRSNCEDYFDLCLCGNGVVDAPGEECDDITTGELCIADVGGTCNYCDQFCKFHTASDLLLGNGDFDSSLAEWDVVEFGDSPGGPGFSSAGPGSCVTGNCAQFLENDLSGVGINHTAIVVSPSSLTRIFFKSAIVVPLSDSYCAKFKGSWLDGDGDVLSSLEIFMGDGSTSWDWQTETLLITSPEHVAFFKIDFIGLDSCSGRLKIDDLVILQ